MTTTKTTKGGGPTLHRRRRRLRRRRRTSCSQYCETTMSQAKDGAERVREQAAEKPIYEQTDAFLHAC
eukprot:3037877-Pyramimonas_sp.AAC.1